jgi:hypothetical protein
MTGMIGRISRHGDVTSLLGDVYDPEQDAEGQAPRIVAGWRPLAELEPTERPGGPRRVRALAELMEMPFAAPGAGRPDAPVWHCHLHAAPQDRLLSDDEWAQIAGDVMGRTGLSPAGQRSLAVPWVAVRRGGHCIHIVATLARQDGGTPRLSSDQYRVGEACRAAEERYSLRRVARPLRRRAAVPIRGDG